MVPDLFFYHWSGVFSTRHADNLPWLAGETGEPGELNDELENGWFF